MSTTPTTIFICVSGHIASGKSTLMDSLVLRYKNSYPAYEIKVIKEFVDYLPEGKECLKNSILGTMKMFDFQKMILNCYRRQLEKLASQQQSKPIRLVFMERNPYESIAVFAHYHYLYSHKLTFGEFDSLSKEALQLCQDHVPSNARFFDINACLLAPSLGDKYSMFEKLINECICQNKFSPIDPPKALYFYVKFSPDEASLREQMNRIDERARIGEGAYQKEYLAKINKLSDQFFYGSYLCKEDYTIQDN